MADDGRDGCTSTSIVAEAEGDDITDALPDTILLAILSLLEAPDLLRCSVVCKRWLRLGREPVLWRGLGKLQAEFSSSLEALRASTGADPPDWLGWCGFFIPLSHSTSASTRFEPALRRLSRFKGRGAVVTPRTLMYDAAFSPGIKNGRASHGVGERRIRRASSLLMITPEPFSACPPSQATLSSSRAAAKMRSLGFGIQQRRVSSLLRPHRTYRRVRPSIIRAPAPGRCRRTVGTAPGYRHTTAVELLITAEPACPSCRVSSMCIPSQPPRVGRGSSLAASAVCTRLATSLRGRSRAE